MFKPVTTHTNIHTVIMLQDVRKSSESEILVSCNFCHLNLNLLVQQIIISKIMFKRLQSNNS